MANIYRGIQKLEADEYWDDSKQEFVTAEQLPQTVKRQKLDFYAECQECDLYENGSCTKFRKNGKCNPSTRNWLVRDEWDEPMCFIPVNRMCRKGSIFGNEYIGLTNSDIERIKNGEVIHIPGEYGTFIGFITEEDSRT